MSVSTEHPAEQPPAPPGEWVVPASYAQERIWFASQLAADTPTYKLLDQYQVRSALPYGGMRAVVGQLCRRHEPLRTGLRSDPDGAVVQVVHADVELPVSTVDLTGRTDAEREAVTDRILHELGHTPLPLDRPPLWRMVLAPFGDGEWDVMFVGHHSVVDAIALEVLREEMATLAAGGELPELPIQYADHAVWQRTWLGGGRLAELLGHWRPALAGIPAVHGVPTDRPRPAETGFGGDHVVRPLPAGARAGAAELARRTGSTPFMVMFAAWVAVLHGLSGDEDVVIGLPVAGRDQPEVQRLVGMFVNVLPIRVDLTGRPTYARLLERVRAALLAAWDAQDMPFQKLVEELAPDRRPGLPPLYQLGFNYLDIGFSRRRVTAAEDDLTLEVSGDDFRVEYATALFDEATAARIAGRFADTLTAFLADPDAEVPGPAATTPASTPATTPAGAATTASAAGPAGPAGAEAEPAAGPGPGWVAPRTAAEELVAEVWGQVLGRDRVGATDDFFVLGGHSLLALRVIARLSAAAGVDLPIQDFFADTTVAGVAGALERILAADLDELTDDEAERLVAGNGQDA